MRWVTLNMGWTGLNWIASDTLSPFFVSVWVRREQILMYLTLPVLRRIFTTGFRFDEAVLLTLGRIYGGQKVNG